MIYASNFLCVLRAWLEAGQWFVILLLSLNSFYIRILKKKNTRKKHSVSASVYLSNYSWCIIWVIMNSSYLHKLKWEQNKNKNLATGRIFLAFSSPALTPFPIRQQHSFWWNVTFLCSFKCVCHVLLASSCLINVLLSYCAAPLSLPPWSVSWSSTTSQIA